MPEKPNVPSLSRIEITMTFAGKTAIVTGGTRGIGRAICLELGRQGCNIAFNYARSAEQAESLVASLQALGRKASAYLADVADYAAVEAMIAGVKKEFGHIDCLVNNAGIIRDKLLLAMSENDWDEVIATNLKGIFNVSKLVVGAMIRARSGAILNMTSISGVVGTAGQTNYAASKAGVIGFTKALAKEVASRNITVNALALGLIATDMTESLSNEYKEKMLQAIPLGRFGTPEEIGRIGAFLLSDAARYITGQVIQVDGGMAI
jgi:3-oxoacyl-[acyl-carrier protein] reductase